MLRTTIKFIALVSFAITICMAARVYAEPAPKTETIVVAGGCFWGVQAVFQHTRGVVSATSGYAGGKADTANYETVSTGTTVHAESVEITYYPSQISLDQLLDVYFVVAHNSTELNYQGPDHGTQYRSTIFYSSEEQKKAAQEKITELSQNKKYSDPVVTTLESLSEFHPAEAYHQNFATLHPNHPYIRACDAPKLSALEKTFPELYIK